MSNLPYWQEKIQEKRKQTPWRNFLMEICSRQAMNIYKNKGAISRYPETWREPPLVSPREFGKNIETREIGIKFLHEFTDLYKHQEQMRLMQWFDNENCDYAEVYGAKNCYLSFSVGLGAENMLYSFIAANNIKNTLNSLSVMNGSENVYSSRIIISSYNIFYASNIHNSHNIWFSSNLIGCSECLYCSWLTNQSYMIHNKQYSKDDYIREKEYILQDKELFDKSYTHITEQKIENILSENVIWWWLNLCSNINNGYSGFKITDGQNFFIAWGWESNFLYCYDCLDVGFQWLNHDYYGVHYCGEWSNNIYCCSSISSCSHVFYSYFLENCSFCLWCIGLKNKQFCILNKQYSKGDRYTKVDEIFSQMEKDWTLGEFFPASMNPFYFNDTAAYLIDSSFTKEEVIAKWYLRRDEPIKVDIPEWSKVVKTSELDQYEWRIINGDFIPQTRHPERNEVESKDLISLWWDPSTTVGMTQTRWIDPEILNCIIQDESWNIYRIVKMEYDFLIKHWLPLPRKHRLDRMKENFRIGS